MKKGPSIQFPFQRRNNRKFRLTVNNVNKINMTNSSYLVKEDEALHMRGNKSVLYIA